MGHIKGEYQVKDPLLLRYYHKVLNIMQNFSNVEIKHIPREQNSRDDSLSKLASQRRQTQHNSIIQRIMNSLTVGVEECLAVAKTKDVWIKSYKEIIKNQEQGIENDVKIARKAAKFVIIGEELYKRGHSTPLLKCLSKKQAEYVIRELHEGLCGLHCNARTMTTKVLRVGYYWPMVREDCNEYVTACKKCQESQDLQGIVSPWPFAKWEWTFLVRFP